MILLPPKIVLCSLYVTVTLASFTVMVAFTFILSAKQRPEIHVLNNNERKPSRSQEIQAENEIPLEKRFEKRRGHSSSVCKKKHGYYGNNTAPLPNESSAFEYSFYDERFNVIFCTIPKVASAHWKLVFEAAVKGDVNLTNGKNDRFPGKPLRFMERLINLYSDVRSEMLRKYSKVIFVRNPLERLISAWRNRFIPPKTPTYRDIAKYIIQTYRHNHLKVPGINVTQADENDFVTLEEFFKFLVEEGSKPGKWDDPHWRSQVRHCEPCRVGYDLIGRFENLEDESAYITSTLFLQKNLKLHMPAQGSFAADLSQAKLPKQPPTFYYASTVPADLLNKITDAYADDFEIFGYPRINYS